MPLHRQPDAAPELGRSEPGVPEAMLGRTRDLRRVPLPRLAQSRRRLLPAPGLAVGRQASRQQHRRVVGGTERPCPPQAHRGGTRAPHDLRHIELQRRLTERAQQRIVGSGPGLALQRPPALDEQRCRRRAGLASELDDHGLEPLPVDRPRHGPAAGRRGDLLPPGDSGGFEIGDREVDQRGHVVAAELGYARRRRLRMPPLHAPHVSDERPRRHERQVERLEHARDQLAPRAPLAEQREVEPLAREIRELQRPRDAAQLRHSHAGIVGARPGHEPHVHAGMAQQLRQQVGVLPIEIDQHDASR